jgi:hypothetical protein
VERALDVREGDVHDGRVQHHHELRARDDRQREPRVAAAARLPRGALRSRT